MEESGNKHFFYPPGGILIWVIILLELITFGAGILAFLWQSRVSPVNFDISQKTLQVNIGLTNTLLLIVSGFFVAEAVRFLKEGKGRKSVQFMGSAILLGLGFLVVKGVEYADKLQQGYDLSHNAFFSFYWLLTGFHYLHVLTGLVILTVLTLKMRRGAYHERNYFDIETGAAFWHMCDIIWLLLFPVLYLL